MHASPALRFRNYVVRYFIPLGLFTLVLREVGVAVVVSLLGVLDVVVGAASPLGVGVVFGAGVLWL